MTLPVTLRVVIRHVVVTERRPAVTLPALSSATPQVGALRGQTERDGDAPPVTMWEDVTRRDRTAQSTGARVDIEELLSHHKRPVRTAQLLVKRGFEGYHPCLRFSYCQLNLTNRTRSKVMPLC